jgi:hypothetical protein
MQVQTRLQLTQPLLAPSPGEISIVTQRTQGDDDNLTAD